MGAGVTPTTYFGSRATTSSKMQEMEERVQELEKRDKEWSEELEKKQREMDGMKAMMGFMRSHLESTGVQVPILDIGTPRSSIGQVPTCGSAYGLVSEGEDKDDCI